MSNRTTVIKVKARTNPSSAGIQAYQASLVPNATYSGRELYERMAASLGLPSDGFRARTIVQGLESFIRQELEQGNRLDFGLVSFYPKLSAALPTRDADPTEAGLFVRGAVKARSALSDSLEQFLVAENPNAGRPLFISNIYNETCEVYDIVMQNDTLSIVGEGATLDPTHADEGVWLEKLIKRRHQKHIPLVQAELLETGRGQTRCRFTEVPKPGKYNLVVATRGGADTSFKLRYSRRPVRVQ